MRFELLVKMLCLLVMCPALLAAVQTLTIDSQLGTSIEDCFERISIGEQITNTAIYRNVSELTTRECEQICKQDKQCQAYNYGVGAKGNASCELSNVGEKELKEKSLFQRHSDYDIYVRRFQCEQSPPSPLQPSQDDPGDGSGHRPIFRPEVDEKIPLLDDIPDLKPYESNPDLKPIPPYRPQNNYLDRPDGSQDVRPLDSPPSYGLHRPQDLPFRPERPTYKPDPYDVLHFQSHYGRPDSGYWRPDPHYPLSHNDDFPDLYGANQRPLLGPEHHYRPHKRPQRPIDHDYGSKPDDYPIPDGYGQFDPVPSGPSNPLYKPVRPNLSYPQRPYEYHSQYASGYGQSQHHDNEIYVEINDPPRPYRPTRPMNDRPNYGSTNFRPGYAQGIYGYGTYSSQNSYPNPYGSSSDDQSHGYQKPGLEKPDRPSYGGQIDDNPNHNYKPHGTKPTTEKPSYGTLNSVVTSKPNKPSGSYGLSHLDDVSDNQGYGLNGLSQDTKPNTEPSYGNRPTYNDLPPHKPQNKPLYTNRPSYNDEKPSYDTSKPSYGIQRPLYDDIRPSYGDDRPSYGSNLPHYDAYKPTNHPDYQDRPDPYNDENVPGYAANRPSHDDNLPYYGNRPSYNEKPVTNYRPSFEDTQPSYYAATRPYGGTRPQTDNKPHGSRPIGDRPTYGESRPPYSGSNFHDKTRPSDSGYSLYDNTDPSYGSSHSEDYPSYIGEKPSHSQNQPYENKPSNHEYGTSSLSDTSSPYYSKPSQNTRPYGDSKPPHTLNPTKPISSEGSYGGNTAQGQGYYNQTEQRPGIKPVYEYELEKPGNVPSYLLGPNGEVVTSRPVTIADFGYGQGRAPFSYRACFRRVLAGQRALRSHVRRAVGCERLEDCRRECAEERRFHCESFNYRLDPSFRGKGLCELMTKPIEAFNLRRDFVEDKDYDFYEIDRNSLEPNCPETLHGPGLLHSGFLSSKPNRPNRIPGFDRFKDRFDSDDRFYKRGHQFHDERRMDRIDRDFPKRRNEDRFYVPYQIGFPSQSRSNDDETWGQYGGTYGGDYSNREDHTKALSHWQLSDALPKYGVNHDYSNFDYNSLGKGLEYGVGGWRKGEWNSSAEKPEIHFYEKDEDHVKDCSSRRRPGMSLGPGAIRRALLTDSVLECEAACFTETEFTCVSYSYRYSSPPASDNCYLSERPYQGLQLSADSASDVYAMPQRTCSVNYAASLETECFWHVRSGAAVAGAARAALTTSGLGACEAECLRASGFFCRGFSFRYDAPTIGDDAPNCILTSSPPTSLTAGHGLKPNAGHELYARGNFGRGCERALYDTVDGSQNCYLQYDNAAKLLTSAVKGSARVRSEQACGAACSGAPFKCLSFSFSNEAPPGVDNCLMSEIRLWDLHRGVDYQHSPHDWLFAFDLFSSHCKTKHGPLETHIPPIISEGPSGPPGLPGPFVIEHSGPPHLPAAEEPPFIPSGPPSGPSYTHYIPGPAFKPEFNPSYPDPTGFKPGYPPPQLPQLPGPNYPVYPPPETPGYLPRPSIAVEPGLRPGPDYREKDVDEPITVSWRHYTVSGFPCRKGTTCAQNQIAGHWACEPEGGEIGSWDYCCAPTHRCGYSEGFHKPWCYVGPADDQWRPCSEKYYPYHQHNVPHPSQGHGGNRPRPHSSQYVDDRDKPPLGPYLSQADRKYWDNLYQNGPQAYYDKYGNPLPGYTRVPMTHTPHIKYHHNFPPPPSGHWVPLSDFPQELDPPMPGGLGIPRYWPVAYLHKGPPPNMTYFKYNETTTTTERYDPPKLNQAPPNDKTLDFNRKTNEPSKVDLDIKRHRDEKNRNITNAQDDLFALNTNKIKTSTSEPKVDIVEARTEEINNSNKSNVSEVETVKEIAKETEKEDLKGIDDKLEDFSKSIEILDIEDAKGEKVGDLKTLEAEEKQIEAIGRLLASRRGGKLVLEKRSQKDLETKNIAVDKDLVDFNFGNRFPTSERRGTIQRVTKDEIERERNLDKSLEVSETTYVRPPRVLTTTENIRKAFVNGKVFYDASMREQRESLANNTRKAKNLRPLEERAPSVINNSNYGKKKVIKARNVNPVRRVRRVYRKRYNPEEVRRRLLERDRSMKQEIEAKRS